jgi:hypothetical protein
MGDSVFTPPCDRANGSLRLMPAPGQGRDQGEHQGGRQARVLLALGMNLLESLTLALFRSPLPKPSSEALFRSPLPKVEGTGY